MNKPKSAYRFTQASQGDFGPSLEWHSLPVLGQDDRRLRPVVWRLIGAASLLFWGGVAALVAWAVIG